jgi:hypothetical protein
MNVYLVIYRDETSVQETRIPESLILVTIQNLMERKFTLIAVIRL